MVLSLIPFQSWESHNRLMLVSSRPYIFSHFRLTINEKIHRNSSNPITERLLNSLHLRINLLILIARILLRHIFKVGSWRTGLTLKIFFPPKKDVPRRYWTSLLLIITHRSGEIRFLSLSSSTCYFFLLLKSDFKCSSLNTSYICTLAS